MKWPIFILALLFVQDQELEYWESRIPPELKKRAPDLPKSLSQLEDKDIPALIKKIDPELYNQIRNEFETQFQLSEDEVF